MANPSVDTLLGVLRASHSRFAAAVSNLSEQELNGPSYDRDWTIAQVASHLGSGAEIFTLLVSAGREHSATPGGERFQAVWAAWDAKSPSAQAGDAVTADAALLDRLAALTSTERDDWRLELFGGERDLPALLRMRLSEHALHTWDIVVAGEPSATLASDAVPPILENLEMMVERAGKGAADPVTVAIATSVPEQEFELALTADGARLVRAGSGEAPPRSPAEGASLRLPAEAFIRLVYGRLDPAHTPPSVQTQNVELDLLRSAFPGV